MEVTRLRGHRFECVVTALVVVALAAGSVASSAFFPTQTPSAGALRGLNEPNAYGHRPLAGNNPETPDVKEGPANDYWDHVATS